MGCCQSSQVSAAHPQPASRVVIAEDSYAAQKLTTDTVKKQFPGALLNEEFLVALRKVSKALNLTAENTLFGHSLCPDEINHEPGDLSFKLESFFGEVFTFGGLAGIPFVGKTGFGAFSHHVSEGGNLFIAFAAHVAVTQDKVGYYHRVGQHHESTACGAAMGAYGAVKNLTEEPPVWADGDDFQMDYIKRGIWRQRERISKAAVPEVEIAMVTYEMVRDLLLKIIDPHAAKGGKIVLLGGIQINAQPDDYFLPLFLQSFEGGSDTPKDLFSLLSS